MHVGTTDSTRHTNTHVRKPLRRTTTEKIRTSAIGTLPDTTPTRTHKTPKTRTTTSTITRLHRKPASLSTFRDSLRSSVSLRSTSGAYIVEERPRARPLSIPPQHVGYHTSQPKPPRTEHHRQQQVPHNAIATNTLTKRTNPTNQPIEQTRGETNTKAGSGAKEGQRQEPGADRGA